MMMCSLVVVDNVYYCILWLLIKDSAMLDKLITNLCQQTQQTKSNKMAKRSNKMDKLC